MGGKKGSKYLPLGMASFGCQNHMKVQAIGTRDGTRSLQASGSKWVCIEIGDPPNGGFPLSFPLTPSQKGALKKGVTPTPANGVAKKFIVLPTVATFAKSSLQSRREAQVKLHDKLINSEAHSHIFSIWRL